MEPKYIADGFELSTDPCLRATQLRREAERLERKAARNPIFAAAAREAREDADRARAAYLGAP